MDKKKKKKKRNSRPEHVAALEIGPTEEEKNRKKRKNEFVVKSLESEEGFYGYERQEEHIARFLKIFR